MGASQVELLLSGVRDASGNPLDGGKVYTYEPGTTTDKTMWTAQDKSGAAANPIILDSAGRASVWAEGMYKLKIDDSADTTLYTYDNQAFFVDDGIPSWAGTSGGSSDAYTATPTPNWGAYVAGQTLGFVANHTNSGAATMNVSSLGAKNILKEDGSTTLAADDIAQGTLYTLKYDGTAFRITAGAQARPFILSRDATEVTLSNSTTLTTLVTVSIPANTIGADSGIRYRILGSSLNSSGGNVVYTFDILYGTAALFGSLNTFTLANDTGFPFAVNGVLVGRGTTSQQVFQGTWFNGATGSGVGGNATEDVTTTLDLKFRVQMDTADALASFTFEHIEIEAI